MESELCVIKHKLMTEIKKDGHQGHWLLAKMGKRVLRPGGKALTLKMLDGLQLSTEDRVIEFAPGMGFTAEKVLQKHPSSYTGVELNPDAAARLRKRLAGPNRTIVEAHAGEVPLRDGSADKVYGEAMLTMQADHRKLEIIREAARLLRPGGLYGIHELGLTPNELDAEAKKEIQQGLARAIMVNARPLTEAEWRELLEEAGFEVIQVMKSPMLLLQTIRMIADEGLPRFLLISYNLMRFPIERARILEMKNVFKRYEKNLNAVAIIARKR